MTILDGIKIETYYTMPQREYYCPIKHATLSAAHSYTINEIAFRTAFTEFCLNTALRVGIAEHAQYWIERTGHAA